MRKQMLFGSRMSPRTLALLRWECTNITEWLAAYGPSHGTKRRAVLDDSGEFIRVLGMPLPTGYYPPASDLVLVVDSFPVSPPYGLFLLDSHKAQVRKITALFGHPHVQVGGGIEDIPGYAWVCYYYPNGWHYCAEAPVRGDNLRKFLASWYATLASGYAG
jgi:hypothetical protein